MDAGRLQQLLTNVEQLFHSHAHGFDGVDVDGLRRLGERSMDVQSWLAAVDASIAAAARARGTAATPVDAGGVVGGGGRRSHHERERIVDRAAACDTVAGIGEALAAGEVGAAHVDAIAAATRNLSDAAKARFGDRSDGLVEHARLDSPEEFARRCRNLAKHVDDENEKLRVQERLRQQRKVSRWVDRDGMCHTKLSLDPLANQQVWAAIEAMVASARAENQHGDDRTFDQLQADAVVELLTRSGDGDVLARVPEVCVHVDLATLLGMAADAGISLCETADGQALPVETVRRLCCEGNVVPVVLNGRSVPLDLGRGQRLASPAQRQALRAIYATCAHSGCSVRFDRCRIHHVRFWEHFGGTDLGNMVPVCSRHHHLVHEGGWTLTIDADRVATWTAPDGFTTLRSTPNRITVDRHARGGLGVGGGPAAVSDTRRLDEIDASVGTGTGGRTGGCVGVGGRDGVDERDGHSSRASAARQMADAVVQRRRQRQAGTAGATARRPRHADVAAPVPLFTTDDPISRRGPPAAS